VARIAGRNGRIYIALASGGTAEPLNFMATWSINFATDKFEVTAMGDTAKSYVAGLPDSSGEFSGFYDDSTVQTYTAATDGVARKMYIYPSLLTPGQYWYGTVFPDFNVSGGVGGAVEVTASWNSASGLTKVG
jgi:hypothetical protein